MGYLLMHKLIILAKAWLSFMAEEMGGVLDIWRGIPEGKERPERRGTVREAQSWELGDPGASSTWEDWVGLFPPSHHGNW